MSMTIDSIINSKEYVDIVGCVAPLQKWLRNQFKEQCGDSIEKFIAFIYNAGYMQGKIAGQDAMLYKIENKLNITIDFGKDE